MSGTGNKNILFFFIGLFLLTSCKKDQPTDPNKDSDKIGLRFTLTASGLRYLRIGEHYVLWAKARSDTSWTRISQLDTLGFNSQNEAVAVGLFDSKLSLDSITDALLTIQPPNSSTPSFDFPIAEAHHFIYDSAVLRSTASLTSVALLGDYTATQGNVVYTSTRSDSLAYTHEFYLMNYSVGSQTQSVVSLPLPPKGWQYGLWVQDSNFVPHQKFFYGLFSKAIGHDSDSTNDAYSFPGGWKAPNLASASGSIIVTLEPNFYGDSLKFNSPSPFTILSLNRTKFLEKNKSYRMENVAGQGLPNGTLIFRKY
ncbi:MAG: hypothetical protein WCH46_03490 [bacterium]